MGLAGAWQQLLRMPSAARGSCCRSYKRSSGVCWCFHPGRDSDCLAHAAPLPQGRQLEGAPTAEDGLKHLLLFISDDTLCVLWLVWQAAKHVHRLGQSHSP